MLSAYEANTPSKSEYYPGKKPQPVGAKGYETSCDDEDEDEDDDDDDDDDDDTQMIHR